MTDASLVDPRRPAPVTARSLTDDLRRLGLPTGAVVLLHTSLRGVGWIAGGAVAVIDAVEAVIGSTGTLVVPTQSGSLTDPSDWSNPPVPASWWPVIRAETPPYRRDATPTRGMGVVPECLRAMCGSRRSGHPHFSFAARGPAAEALLEPHEPEAGLGEESPLGRLHDAGAWTLLLGCGHDANTALHLAEYRASYPGWALRREGAPMLVDGARRWLEWDDLALSSADFPRIGADLEAAGGVVRIGDAGWGTARLMPIRELVAFGVGWMTRHRGQTSGPHVAGATDTLP